MSKEQLTEQQVEVVGTERDSAAPAQTHGLPPHVYAQVMALGPADAPALADLLTSFPDLSVRILTVASPHMGNAAVQRAITIAQKQSAQGKAGTLSQAEMHEVLDDKPAQGKAGTLSQAEMHEVLDDKPASAEPAWVGGARKYNAAHAEFVSDFNELTNNSCLDAAGQLDPQAVARWQRQHGVEADGKIGPHTVAAARAAQVKAGSAGAIAEQRIDV
ncbi:MAG TPA: hypothetical protein VHN14_04090 [Kofleriaceae bacterium]|nr:hypothetical protein [Kofleriaceae bacterium]